LHREDSGEERGEKGGELKSSRESGGSGAFDGEWRERERKLERGGGVVCGRVGRFGNERWGGGVRMGKKG